MIGLSSRQPIRNKQGRGVNTEENGCGCDYKKNITHSKFVLAYFMPFRDKFA